LAKANGQTVDAISNAPFEKIVAEKLKYRTE
jgi:hypothetical protein